jgi:hypothetical protein
MLPLADLAGAGQKILNVFAAQLTSQGVDLPDRQYFSATQVPVWDGEQFTVALAGIAQGQPGAPVSGTMVATSLVQYAQFTLSLVRVMSVLQTDGPYGDLVPDADIMNADGVQIASDASALWTAAAAIKGNYLLVDPGEAFVVGPLQPLNVEGGLAATRMMIDVSIV